MSARDKVNRDAARGAMQGGTTPLTRYRAEIKSGALRADMHQECAVKALDDLFAKVAAAKRPKPKKGGILGLFALAKRSDADVIKGLYIYGAVGRGKSMLMDLFYHCLPAELPSRRSHFHEFMIALHDYLHEAQENKNKATDRAILDYAEQVAAGARVLCFDEFHVTDIATAMLLERLFTALFDAGVVIVATSNWAPDRLYENGLQRERFLPFIELLKQRVDVLALDGPVDYRLQGEDDNAAEDDIYFWPLTPASEKKAAALFTKAAGGAQIHKDILRVKGRDIEIEAAGKAARFTFAALCERPLGAEDYIRIAQKYETICILSIPKLGYDRNNEAVRFMTLIDALYEQGANVIMTADAPIEEIYRDGKRAFEFERTVSRIMEMRGKDYRYG